MTGPRLLLITCEHCREVWYGHTRDYCPGCGLDHLGQPAPAGGRTAETGDQL
jgi:hypothetical protein